LKTNQRLSSLILSCNNIKDTAMKYLGDAMKTNEVISIRNLIFDV